MKRSKQLFIAEIILLLILFSTNKSLFIAFMSITIHEITHVVIARIKGSDFNNLHINIYGSKVNLINIDELTDNDKIIVYISGSISNLMIILTFLCIRFYIKDSIVERIIGINFGLIFFNLLPAYPLDGSRILEVILSKKILYRKAQDVIAKISYIISLFFIISFIVIAITMKEYNITLLFAALLIFYITRKEIKASAYILMGNIFMKRNKLLRNKYLENRSISVYYKLGLANVMSIIDKDRFNIFYILDDDMKIVFIMYEDELIEALKNYGNISLEEYSYKKTGKSR